MVDRGDDSLSGRRLGLSVCDRNCHDRADLPHGRTARRTQRLHGHGETSSARPQTPPTHATAFT